MVHIREGIIKLVALHQLHLVRLRVPSRVPWEIRDGHARRLHDSRLVLAVAAAAAGERLGAGLALAAAHGGEAARAAEAVAQRRLLPLRVLVPDAAEKAGHAGEAGADDAGVELDQGPDGQVAVVVGRVGRRGPGGQEPEAGDGAGGDEEAEQEDEDDAGLCLPVGLELEAVSVGDQSGVPRVHRSGHT